MIERVRVKSETNRDQSYVVTFVGNTAVACTCLNFHYRATEDGTFSCKHMRTAENVQPLSTADLFRIRSLLRG